MVFSLLFSYKKQTGLQSFCNQKQKLLKTETFCNGMQKYTSGCCFCKNVFDKRLDSSMNIQLIQINSRDKQRKSFKNSPFKPLNSRIYSFRMFFH